MMRLLTKDDVEIHLIREDEDMSIEEGLALCEDPKLVKRVERRAKTNPWAWFCANVSVSFEGIESDEEYLGGCSYKSEKDFRENSGYFDDMVQTCVDNLNEKLQAVVTSLRTKGIVV